MRKLEDILRTFSLILTQMIYIVSSPSGSGKSSLIQALIKDQFFCKNIKISISYTTRKIRPGEIHGKHYFFVSKKRFKKLIEENIFLEHTEIFGNYYGTSRLIIEENLKNDLDIFLDVDWQGAQLIRKKIKNTRSIFILPPSKEILINRLINRNGKNEKDFNLRIKGIKEEVFHYKEYDYLIINSNFDHALLDLKNIIFSERLRMKAQKRRYKSLIKSLMEV